jgi:hypothetical protein
MYIEESEIKSYLPNQLEPYVICINQYILVKFQSRGGRMVVGFITTNVISAYHH